MKIYTMKSHNFGLIISVCLVVDSFFQTCDAIWVRIPVRNDDSAIVTVEDALCMQADNHNGLQGLCSISYRVNNGDTMYYREHEVRPDGWFRNDVEPRKWTFIRLSCDVKKPNLFFRTLVHHHS